MRLVGFFRFWEDPKLTRFRNPKLAKLRAWRNRLLAHQDYDLTLEGLENFLTLNPVNLEEIQKLIDEGFSILERWASYYQRKSEIPKLVERKDGYRFVLESLRLGLLRHPKW